MKTVNELIKELQNLKPSLRELPILIVAPNGLTFEPKAKVLMRDKQTMFDEPKEMVITYDQQFLLFLLRVSKFVLMFANGLAIKRCRLNTLNF